MKPERWQQISEICNAALARDVAERSAFLRDACADDAELRSEVESLLRHERDEVNFLERPALDITANVAIQAQQQSMAGRRLGPYEILASIGAGGMGEVYKAHDTRLKRPVAIKILSPEFSQDHDRRARFVREAQSIAALNHPHICTIHDVGQHDGVDYLVMEYLEGRTLREGISEGPLAADEARQIAMEIAAALSQAHRRGIVHRDVKPGNIMLTGNGTKLLDFGLAKAIRSEDLTTSDFKTATGVVLGTAAYMSPEQLLGLAVDARSDVFSLGVVLYEMAIGARPFRGANVIDTVDAILNKQPEPIESAVVPEDLRRVIYKCLEKKADDRFRSADEMVLSMATGSISVRREGMSSDVHAGIDPPPSTTEQSAITERDAILIADLANATSDPIFDGTLNEALAVKLVESPYLNIVSDDRLQHTLRLMGRPADEPLTPLVSREICERQGIKAMVTGSIAKLGRQYVITLATVNCQNGDSIARAQTVAANKDGVLRALGAATTRLREKLGESLASIRRFDMPVQDVTTSSLDALKAYSLACSLRAAGKEREAVPPLKHAIELDPNFALAHAILGSVYHNLGELTLRDQYVAEAYQQRSRVTEPERLLITVFFHKAVTGDLLKEFETLTLLTQVYPRNSSGFNMLGHYYATLGQFDRAAEKFRESGRLDSSSLNNLAWACIHLNRLEEARTLLERIVADGQDYALIHDLLMQVTYLQHDHSAMQRELEWLTVHNPSAAFSNQAWVACLTGSLQNAHKFLAKCADLHIRDGLVERAALGWLSLAESESLCGIADSARRHVRAAMKLSTSRDVTHLAARILAMSGFHEEAQPLLDQCLNNFPPTHTLANAVYIPAVRAALDLTHGNAGAAIEELQAAEPYDGTDHGVVYLKALACLAANRAADAEAEFQKLIDRGRGGSPYTPIAHLGRARAFRLMGDLGRSRTMYESFFDLWKNADADLPILVAAKQEYALLE